MKKFLVLIFLIGVIHAQIIIPPPPPPPPPPPVPAAGQATDIVLLDDATAIQLVAKGLETLQTMLEAGWFNTLLTVFALIGFAVLIISMWISGRFDLPSIVAYFLVVLFILFAFTYKGGSKMVIFRRYYMGNPTVGEPYKVPYGLWLILGLSSEIMAKISEQVDVSMGSVSKIQYRGLGNNLSAIYSSLMSRVPLPAGYREVVEDFANQCLFEPLSKGLLSINSPDGIKRDLIKDIQLTYYKKPDKGGEVALTVHPDSNTTFTCGDYWDLIIGPNFDVDTALYHYYERNGYIKHKYVGFIPGMPAVYYTDYFCVDPNDSTTCFPLDTYREDYFTTPDKRYIKGMVAVTVSKVLDRIIKNSKMENVMAEGTANQGFISKGLGNLGETIARFILFWTARAVIKGAPLLQSFVITLLILMYPVIVALMLVPGFGGFRYAWGYFTSFLWVLSWGVVFIMLSHFASIRLDTEQVLNTLANLTSTYIVVPTSYIKYLKTQVDIATIVQALLIFSTPALTYPVFMRGGAGLVSVVGAGIVGQAAGRSATTVTKAAGVTATE